MDRRLTCIGFLLLGASRLLAAPVPDGAVVLERARAARLAALRQQLASDDPAVFSAALEELATGDEPGTLRVWEQALATAGATQRDAIRQRFAAVRDRLARHERVAQVVRLAAAAEALRAVRAALEPVGGSLDVTTWQIDGESVVAALAPASRRRLAAAGIAGEVLFDSVAAWQGARRAGIAAAARITPRYQSAAAASDYLPRVLVIDLTTSEPPGGRARFLGDQENVVARNDRYLAYLDLLPAARPRTYLARRYRRRGLRVVGVFAVEDFRAARPRFFPELPAADEPSAAGGYDGQFHSYEEVVAELQDLAARHPDMARLVSLGPTYEGREIWALKVSRNVAVDDPNKPAVLFTGCHHAREWIAVEPPINFARRLTERSAVNDRLRFFVDQAEIWIVPIVNPDGLAYSQQSPNDSADSIRYWRKNRRPINVTGCGSGVGVDLNRNYDFMWRLPGDQPCPQTADDEGASDSPSDFQLYRGPAPLSELEVQALAALTGDPAHHFVARVDFHNYSQLVLSPWSWGSSAPADAATLAALGTRLAQRLTAANGVPYVAQRGVDLYVATGTATDHAYGVDHTIGAFLWELRPQQCCFAVPEAQIGPVNRESWAAARLLLLWSAGPPILASVTAMQTDAGGDFTVPIYGAGWQTVGGRRTLSVTARAGHVQAGRLRLSLRFSKPLPVGAIPVVTLGRVTPFNEVRAVAIGPAEGWQAGAYRKDTWIGEVTMPAGGGDTVTPWRLAVSVQDGAGLALDADPSSIARYEVGSGGWLNDESGPDLQHALPPSGS